VPATGPFVNSRPFNVTYGSFELAAHDYVNAPGSKMLVNGDSGISASGNFHNDGSFELGAGIRASVAGSYSQVAGASFTVGRAVLSATAVVDTGLLGFEWPWSGRCTCHEAFDAGMRWRHKPQQGLSGPVKGEAGEGAAAVARVLVAS
jgi:hypothetical protein